MRLQPRPGLCKCLSQSSTQLLFHLSSIQEMRRDVLFNECLTNLKRENRSSVLNFNYEVWPITAEFLDNLPCEKDYHKSYNRPLKKGPFYFQNSHCKIIAMIPHWLTWYNRTCGLVIVIKWMIQTFHIRANKNRYSVPESPTATNTIQLGRQFDSLIHILAPNGVVTEHWLPTLSENIRSASLCAIGLGFAQDCSN